MLSEYSTADEIVKGTTAEIAILPVGSTEQHGPHLPLATDWLIAKAYADNIGEQLGAFVLPALPVSTCLEHKGKRGSVWMKPDTFYHVLQDIVICLKQQGFRYVVVLIAHGGVFIAGPAIRELNAGNPDIKVIRLETMQFDGTPEMREIVECADNLHACEIETSLMLYLYEKLVRKDLITDYVPAVTRDYLNYQSLLRYSESGVWGKPSLATKEKGKKIFRLVTEKGIKYINEVILLTGDKGYA